MIREDKIVKSRKENIKMLAGFRLLDDDSYVIFITENDCMGRALPTYHIERTICGTGDGSNECFR